ncbi:MAG TPA: hypothetical protein PKA41_19555, partial [Verrucomicrobiota bacterium]|nr:hypothetical protein [Verrucomicrobiota bacterium]
LAMAYNGGPTEPPMRVNTPFPFPPVTTHAATDAFDAVLDEAGATMPSRDVVDLRIVNEARHGTGRILATETNLPALEQWPDYRSLPTPLDTDADGIPDYWERQFGLNTNSAADNMTLTASGYANIEHYLNNTHPTNGTTPIVYIYAAVSRCKAGASLGEWWVARSGSTNAALTVNYTVSGDAIAGCNYTTLPGSITIPAGVKKTKLFLNPHVVNADKVVVVTLQTGNSNYFVGLPNSSLIVIRPATDTDGDGLPNDWETNYFGNITNANAHVDTDGDGFTNLHEYQAGTNPTNALDCLKILSATRTNSDLLIQFASAAGRRYSLERCEDFSGGLWTSTVTNIGGAPGQVTVTHINAAIAGGGFYRVRFTP